MFFEVISYLVQNPKALWVIASAIWLVVVMVSIVLAHYNKEHPFNAINLVFYDSNGKLSDSKARLNGAFIITGWAFVYLTLTDKLTEWYVAAFLTAWVLDRYNSRKAKQSINIGSPRKDEDETIDQNTKG